MNKIQELLKTAYPGDQVEHILSDIHELWTKYDGLESSGTSLSEKDVALITYGDQVSTEGENKLKTLHKFLKDKLEGLVNKIHILPFYPYTSDDGFSVTDYYAVNPELGGWEDVESMSKDFDIMFDAVINHVSQESDWFKKFLKGDPNYANYFINGDDYSDLSKVVRPRTLPLIHEYEGGKRVWTTFSKDQVDINYADPDLFLNVLDVLLFYVAKGAKMIRLDAIGFMWKEDGTTCIHLEQTHNLIKVIRLVIEQVDPTVILITETNVPHKENISYFGEGDEAHMVYNFTLPPLLAYSILNQDTEILKNWASSLELPADNVCFFNFLSSHDGIGVRPVSGILSDEQIGTLIKSAEANGGKVSYRTDASGQSPYEINCNYFSMLKGEEQDEELAVKRMLLAHALLLTFPGLPAIYFHSMFGMQNDLEGLERLGYNRAVNREKFDLQSIESILLEQNSVSVQVSEGIKRLIEIRQQYPQFHPLAKFEILDTPKGVFGIRRFHSDVSVQAIVAYFNLSSEPVIIKDEDVNDDLIGKKKVVDGTVSLKGLQFSWFS